MDIIIDKLILLLLSLPGLLFVPLSPEFVIAFFTAVTFSTFLFAFRDERFQVASVTLFSVLPLVLPECALFLPLLIYDYYPASRTEKSPGQLLLPRIPALALLTAGLFRQRMTAADFPRLFLLLTGCLTALLLRFRTAAYAALSLRFRQARDNDTEIKLLLEEKNKTLLEKQNSELYAATLRERNRIAREIHDNVGHMLTRSILMVGALKTINKDPAMAGPLLQLDATLNQSMDSVRKSVHDLHDQSVDLKEALQTLIREFSYCPVHLQYSMSPEVPREVKYSFISIAREALVNIARHSNATSADIIALEHPGFYQFIIQDNGTSAPPAPSPHGVRGESYFENRPGASGPPGSLGIGLENIRSRVKALNGNLQIRTAPGFRIYITVPKGDTAALEKQETKKEVSL